MNATPHPQETDRFAVSRARLQESSRYLAGGVASSLRAAMKPTPIFAESGCGSRIRDVDGNEYIDYLLAYGPLILGHAHPGLIGRLHDDMKRGFTYGVQHDGEIRLAKKLTELIPCAEQVALSGSGTEAVMLALRLARAYTGKTKIVRFHGHYHGWSDSIFTAFPSADMKSGRPEEAREDQAQVCAGTSGQSELSLQDIILLPWNDPAALESALRLRGHEIAAVITEPVMCNSGCMAPLPSYLERMREWTSERGVVLVFDEVITGFRLGLSGAQGRFGVVPDLATMGKALAGGVALSAVAGRRDIMGLIGQGKVNHLGTLNGNCLATSSALATIELLEEHGGALFQSMERFTERLAASIRELLRKHRMPGVVNQIGPVFHFMFVQRDRVADFAAFGERDAQKYARFAELMLSEGILLRSSGLWYVSAAHGEADLERTVNAIDRVLGMMQQST